LQQYPHIEESEFLAGRQKGQKTDQYDPFPQAFRNGTHFTRWKLSEILDWMDSLRDAEDDWGQS